MKALLLSLAAALFAQGAAAHDTWFEPRPAEINGEALLALGTGNRFPVQEFALTMDQLQRSGCSAADGTPRPLRRVRDTPTALLLATTGVQCWAQTEPLDIELTPGLVAVYLKEINAPPAVHAAWAEQQRRGVGWKERYAKHARIVLQPDTSVHPDTLALDIRMDRVDAPLRAGVELGFQVLRDGVPLPGLAVELHGERSALGFWKRTDGDGRVRFTVPLSGRWVLRGTELRASDIETDTWLSRFVTLAFDVPAAARAQNGSSSTASSRSASHSDASSAISAEPPANTTRR